MKVLHLIAPISFGGGESLLCGLLEKKMPALEEEIALIYASSLFEKRLSQLGIKTYRLKNREIGQAMSRSRVFWETFGNFFLFFQLIKIVKKNRIDIMHAHGFPAVLLACMVSLFSPKLKLLYTHHFYRQKPRRRLEKKIFEWLYNRCYDCTAVSRTVADSMNEAFDLKRPFNVVYNCVADYFFTPSGEVNEKMLNQFNLFADKRKKFIQVARFSPFKNHSLVVESVAQLPLKIKSEILVVFAGEGPEKQRIIKMVEMLGVQNQFVFLGMVDHAELPFLLDQCDYGLFPSELEGFGIGAVECLARGLPVLALDNLLMREIIRDHGLLVTPSELSSAFQKLIEFPVIYPNTSEYAKKFTCDAVKRHYLQFYKRLAE